MTIADAIRAAATRLAPTSETARLDAELLMAHALGCSRSDMLLRAMRDPAPDGFDALIDRRAAHEPVAYITGSAEFYGLDLQVSPAVLIPRGDSETLIDAAREHFADRAPPARILDLGTGSGALLLAALSIWTGAEGVGLDASMPALKQAHCNATKLAMADRASFMRRSWHREGWRRGLHAFDLILCNPPYIPAGEIDGLAAEVARFDPRLALDGGDDGLDCWRAVLPRIAAGLSSGGRACLEIGAGQEDAVLGLAAKAGLCEIGREKDLAGICRCLVLGFADNPATDVPG